MDALPLADLLQALADPTRLRILALLRRMELSVGELAQLLGQSQPRVSRHVRILADAGVVERRKEGSWVFLKIADGERTAPMFALIDGWADTSSNALFDADSSKLSRIRAERAEALQATQDAVRRNTIFRWAHDQLADLLPDEGRPGAITMMPPSQSEVSS